MTRTLRRPIFVMAAMVIAAMWFASAAQAGAPTFSPVPIPRPAAQPQMPCDTRDYVVRKLGETYGETRRGAGLSGPTVIFEVWASKATGTWTIMKTTPNGWTCIVAVGDGWQDDTGELIPTGNPA